MPSLSARQSGLNNTLIVRCLAHHVAHSPREAVDDLPENQCADFRGGAHHFVEVAPDRRLIREALLLSLLLELDDHLDVFPVRHVGIVVVAVVEHLLLFLIGEVSH